MSKDDTYYCEAMVILMDEVLFKIPRFVFQESEVFEHMFTVPPPAGTVVDGTDDEHPLRLDGHRAEDFKQFLRVVLPTSTIVKEPTTWQQWSSVLKLSTMWGFNLVREKAIKKISSSDIQALDQIILAKKYGVSSWLVPTLQKLAQQDEPLNFDDARRLSTVAGWEFTLQLGHLRETYSKSGPFKFCDLGWSACGQCGGTAHYVRCLTHNTQLHYPGPTSQAVVQWPCNTCTTYRCINNPTAYSWEKPAETRAAHDFRPAIRKIFDIDD